MMKAFEYFLSIHQESIVQSRLTSLCLAFTKEIFESINAKVCIVICLSKNKHSINTNKQFPRTIEVLQKHFFKLLDIAIELYRLSSFQMFFTPLSKKIEKMSKKNHMSKNSLALKNVKGQMRARPEKLRQKKSE